MDSTGVVQKIFRGATLVSNVVISFKLKLWDVRLYRDAEGGASRDVPMEATLLTTFLPSRSREVSMVGGIATGDALPEIYSVRGTFAEVGTSVFTEVITATRARWDPTFPGDTCPGDTTP